MIDAVTVVVPTKDRVGVLRQCVASVLGQIDVDVHVVVVDDGSVHDDVAAVMAALDGRIDVVRNEVSLGPSAARNRGVAVALTDWVAFCDDDDLWAPDKLTSQLAAARGRGVEWSCTASLTVDPGLAVIGHARAPRSGDVLSPLLAFNVVPGGGSSVLAARDLVLDAGGFDETMRRAEDWDLWIRLAMRSPLAAVDRPLVAYRVWPRSESLDTAGMAEGHALVCARYHELAVERGVLFDELGALRWFAKQHLRAGRRCDAMRTFAAVAREEGGSAWGRALAAGVAPQVVDRLGDARTRRDVPGAWRAEGEAWLAAVGDMRVPA